MLETTISNVPKDLPLKQLVDKTVSVRTEQQQNLLNIQHSVIQESFGFLPPNVSVIASSKH
jgi:hypothetical protein